MPCPLAAGLYHEPVRPCWFRSTASAVAASEAGTIAIASVKPYDDFDLVVRAIFDPNEAVGLLSQLHITYVKPEIQSGTTWRIPKRYSAQQLRERLRHLPCRFNLGSLYFEWQVLERMKGSASLQYDLVENTGFRNEI